jgi:hypothetical protein
MLPKEQRKAFDAFYESARYNKILEPKTTLMLHMAVSAGRIQAQFREVRQRHTERREP